MKLPERNNRSIRPMKRPYSTVNIGGSLEEGSPDIVLGEVVALSKHHFVGERDGQLSPGSGF